jgi:diguanylate cyclase (GGDEF)-like protein/PAS domain S-box-containing protein
MRINCFAWRSLKTKLTLFSLAIFLLTLWSLTFYASQILRADLERLSSEQQFATVSLLATHINDELAERLNALHSVANALQPQTLSDTAQLQRSLEGLPVLQSIFNGGFFITDLDGIAGASVPLALGRAGVSYVDRDYIAQTLASGTATIGQPVMGRRLGVPAIGMAVPINDPQGKLIGTLAGIINLGQANFLERITASHYGKSGGYTVVARQARRVVTATDKSQVMQALPAQGNDPMVDRAVAGEEGSGLFTNSAGITSLGSVKGIPLTNWYLQAALPVSEAFAPITSMQQRLLLTTLALSLLAAMLVRWMLSRQLAPMLSAAQALSNRNQAKQQLQPLAVTGNDEIAELLRGFNHLLATLAQREEALKDSQFRWQFAIEGSGDGVWDWQIPSNQASYSSRWKSMLGYREEDILPNHQEWLSRIHPNDQRSTAAALQAHLDGNSPVYIAELRLRCRDGSYKWVRSRGMLVSRSADGQPLRMIGTHTDISAAKHSEGKLQLAASVFTYAHEGIMITTADGSIIDVNDAVTRITGYARDELLGQNPRIFNSGRHSQSFYQQLFNDLQEQGYWDGEIWNRRKSGDVFVSMQTITAIRDEQGAISQYTTLFVDATERKAMEEQVHQLAFFDALTQLPNRRLLDDRFSQAILASTRSGRYAALLFLDLDNFKPLNDTHGHVVGDLLLIEAANRLKACVREIDTVARFGGDEFVVILRDLTFDLATSTAQASSVANKICSALAAPYQLRSQDGVDIEHLCSASIGVALFLDQHTSQADILIWADTAMYAAKTAGRNQVRFSPHVNINTPSQPDWHSQHFPPNS